MRRVVVMQLIKVDPAHKRLQTIITKYNAGLISCSGFDLLSAAAAHDAFAEAIGFVRYTRRPHCRVLWLEWVGAPLGIYATSVHRGANKVCHAA